MSLGKQILESMNQAVWYNQWTLNRFNRYLRGEILEVGCGIGNFTTFLTKYGKIYAIDIQENYLTYTAKLIGKKGKVGYGDIEKGNYFFNGQQFDSIVCLNVLEHIKDDRLALNNLFKLLKKTGTLILLVPSHQYLYGEIDKFISHYRRYDKLDLVYRLEKIGFKIITSKKLNFLGALGWFMTGKILRRNTIEERSIKIFNLISPFILPLENLFEPPIGISILIVAKKV